MATAEMRPMFAMFTKDVSEKESWWDISKYAGLEVIYKPKQLYHDHFDKYLRHMILKPYSEDGSMTLVRIEPLQQLWKSTTHQGYRLWWSWSYGPTHAFLCEFRSLHAPIPNWSG